MPFAGGKGGTFPVEKLFSNRYILYVCMVKTGSSGIGVTSQDTCRGARTLDHVIPDLPPELPPMSSG